VPRALPLVREFFDQAVDSGVKGLVLLSVLDGRNTPVTDGVQQALRRAPRDFSEYVRRTAATGVWRA
jgi:hypothetical protein